MLASETAGLEEVAAAIGKTPAWLKRHWLRFHLQKGFPRKIPAGDVWPRRAVEVWLRSAGAIVPQPLPDNDDRPGFDVVAAASASLSQRFGVT